jgi:hypothetical protein
MRRLASFLGALGALGVSSLVASAHAGELPLETLALNDTASVQEPLELQVTLAPSYLGWKRPKLDAYALSGELELGIIERVQLALEAELVHLDTDGETATGLANPELRLGVGIFDEKALVLSAGVEAEFPGSDPPIGEDAFAAAPFVVADVAFGMFHVTAGSALELEFGDETELVPQFGGGAYLELGPIVPVVEIAASLGEETDVRLAADLFYNLNESWEFGVAGIVGLTPVAPDYGVMAIVTWEAEFGPDHENEEEE